LEMGDFVIFFAFLRRMLVFARVRALGLFTLGVLFYF
jgi:hypothetical protein